MPDHGEATDAVKTGNVDSTEDNINLTDDIGVMIMYLQLDAVYSSFVPQYQLNRTLRVLNTCSKNK